MPIGDTQETICAWIDRRHNGAQETERKSDANRHGLVVAHRTGKYGRAGRWRQRLIGNTRDGEDRFGPKAVAWARVVVIAVAVVAILDQRLNKAITTDRGVTVLHAIVVVVRVSIVAFFNLPAMQFNQCS